MPGVGGMLAVRRGWDAMVVRARASVVFTMLLVVGLGMPAAAVSGDLDPDFGVDGKITTPFPGGAYANDVAVQRDQRIVAVGAAAGPSFDGEFAVVRYLTDGTLDPSFDDDGMLTTPIGPGGVDEASAVGIVANRKIVAAGTDGREAFAVVRYLSDGSLDPAFGGTGIVRTDLTASSDVAHDLAIQDDGRIIVVGQRGTTPRFTVVRYRRNGSLDAAFAGDGTTGLPIAWSFATAVAVQPDGKIVVAGFEPGGLVLARFRRDGALDRTFGRDGVSSGRVWGQFPGAVALQPDGKIVTAGDRDIFAVSIARFGPGGRLDPTFGEDGVVVTKLAPGAEQGLSGLVIRSDGRIVASGDVRPHEYGDTVVQRIVVVRVLDDGILDPTWGGDGKVVTRFPGGADAGGAAAQADGRIVVVGSTRLVDEGESAMIAVRYLA
jgi:uncharacterized delta-60 repeat protein